MPYIIRALSKHHVKAGFFFTGNFYRNHSFKKNILQLQNNGHYLGPHSDKHLLYCDWTKRDLLVTEDSFDTDLRNNILAMKAIGIRQSGNLFIPPYEWWNDTVADWCSKRGIQLFSFTPATRTNVDYTWPELGKAYMSSDAIITALKNFNTRPGKLNGAIILIHAGTDPRRKDKLYLRLEDIITDLKASGYRFKRIDELLQ